MPVQRERVDDFIDDGCYKAEHCEHHFKRWRETLLNGVSYFAIDLEDNGSLDNTGVHTVPPGHYFMLGDNLDHSSDSRTPGTVGYVPFDNLVGRAEIIYFSVRSAITQQPMIRFERLGLTVR